SVARLSPAAEPGDSPSGAGGHSGHLLLLRPDHARHAARPARSARGGDEARHPDSGGARPSRGSSGGGHLPRDKLFEMPGLPGGIIFRKPGGGPRGISWSACFWSAVARHRFGIFGGADASQNPKAVPSHRTPKAKSSGHSARGPV